MVSSPPPCLPLGGQRTVGWHNVGAQGPRKNSGSHIDASHSRQPLVKGERLVRYEVNAVILSTHGLPKTHLSNTMSWWLASARGLADHGRHAPCSTGPALCWTGPRLCCTGQPPNRASTEPKKLFTLLDLCVSSLRRGHANLLCIVPILTDDPRRESIYT